jgi:hypothetical protein
MVNGKKARSLRVSAAAARRRGGIHACSPSFERVLSCSMKRRSGTVEIPVQVLESIDTLDELEDWLTSQNPQIIEELREARKADLAGRFKAWEPRHLSWPTESK